MKRRAMFILLFLIIALTLGALDIGLDLRSLDFLFTPSLRVDGEVAFNINKIKMIVPVRYGNSIEKNLSYFESGILVMVKPIENLGLFVEASLFKLGFLFSDYISDDPIFFSSEASLGWDVVFKHFYIRPRFTVRNSLISEQEKEAKLNEIKQFGTYRVSLTVGINF